MKAHVMKLENNCVIVDEEYFNEIKEEGRIQPKKDKRDCRGKSFWNN